MHVAATHLCVEGVLVRGSPAEVLAEHALVEQHGALQKRRGRLRGRRGRDQFKLLQKTKNKKRESNEDRAIATKHEPGAIRAGDGQGRLSVAVSCWCLGRLYLVTRLSLGTGGSRDLQARARFLAIDEVISSVQSRA